jgi:hypothetical protein
MNYSDISNKDYDHSYEIEILITDINGVNSIIHLEIVAKEIIDLENYKNTGGKFGLEYDYFINKNHVDSDFEPCEEDSFMEDVFSILCMNIIEASRYGSIYEGVK